MGAHLTFRTRTGNGLRPDGTWSDWSAALADSDAQIPISIVSTAGGLAQAQSIFFNIPNSVTQGVELETIWQPIDHLQILFNYSYLDSYVTQGVGVDPADPNAYAPNAHPLFTAAQCQASYLASISSHATPACTPDVFTMTQA